MRGAVDQGREDHFIGSAAIRRRRAAAHLWRKECGVKTKIRKHGSVASMLTTVGSKGIHGMIRGMDRRIEKGGEFGRRAGTRRETKI